MMTGMHTVVDIYCVKCGSYLGWRYVNKNTSKSFLVYNVSWYQPFVCLYFRSLLLRRAKSTRKANLFSKGKVHWFISITGFVLTNCFFFSWDDKCVWQVQGLGSGWEQLLGGSRSWSWRNWYWWMNEWWCLIHLNNSLSVLYILSSSFYHSFSLSFFSFCEPSIFH